MFCIPDAHVVHNVDPEMLKEQLFSPDLLRQWRTGAQLLVFTSEEETDIDISLLWWLTRCKVNFTIIADIVLSRDKWIWLSIDADVSLWMDSMAYNNQPPLRRFCDFVLVTPELHKDFDSFREMDTSPGRSTFPLVALLECWNNRRPVPSPTITKYGKPYLTLDSSGVDELCQWVYDTRERVGQTTRWSLSTSVSSTWDHFYIIV